MATEDVAEHGRPKELDHSVVSVPLSLLLLLLGMNHDVNFVNHDVIFMNHYVSV